MNQLTQLREAWRRDGHSSNDDHQSTIAAFLPAALEIQEMPPHPKARWLARVLLVLFILAVIWAFFGRVNIVASAEGKIIPSARVKKIQPLEKGVVKAILVSEGDHVEQGQALVELDPALTLADAQRLQAELHNLQIRRVSDQTLLQLLQQPEAEQKLIIVPPLTFDPAMNVTTEEQTLQSQLLQQQWQQYRAQMNVLSSSLAKVQAQQAATREVVSKLQQTLPIVTKQAENMKTLMEKDLISEINYLQVEQERIEQFQDLAAEQQNMTQLQAAAAEVREQINLYYAQISTSLLSEISTLHQQQTSTREELNKALDLNSKRILYAPVSGQVQELTINTVGGVVTEAQQLMLIVPDEQILEAEVFLGNQDIGFVREGMPAEIKIHTFPFTKYGVINAEVINVSDDAIIDEQRGLIFSMLLKMESNHIRVEGKDVNLIPGMAITAEVQTGYRRVIEFFLTPLLKHRQESLRER
ncbi:HlyD family type I secretion periplasmic adaptor subunit [Gynuella sp.]|uniref:HlyD family type I secretion periplasmic adaptor subunit n=1 Tax=Gynuella sp. TaxID=2969146 RepID=UPI003D0ECEA7